MKLRIVLPVLSLAFAGWLNAQENKTLRLGAGLGFHGNDVNYAGGMQEASGLFTAEGGGGALGLTLRYDFDQRWMVSSGVGIESFSFKFMMAGNYSLLQPENRNRGVNHEFTTLEVPLMAHYKFNLNCKQARWILGAGIVQGFAGEQKNKGQFVESTEANSGTKTLISEASVNPGFYGALRFSVGREKVFKKGSMFNTSLVLNFGAKEIAGASVSYLADGKEYQHSFTSNNTFIGLRFTYFLSPFRLQAQAGN